MVFAWQVYVNVIHFGLESLVKYPLAPIIAVKTVIVSISLEVLMFLLALQNVPALKVGMTLIAQNLFVKTLVMETVFVSMELVPASRDTKDCLVPIKHTIYMENVVINVLIIVQWSVNQPLMLTLMELEKDAMSDAQRNASLDASKEIIKFQNQLDHAILHIVKN